jgi:hypothetical protein
VKLLYGTGGRLNQAVAGLATLYSFDVPPQLSDLKDFSFDTDDIAEYAEREIARRQLHIEFSRTGRDLRKPRAATRDVTSWLESRKSVVENRSNGWAECRDKKNVGTGPAGRYFS